MRPIAKNHASAFTLMEVLIAIGIFAIGMTAIASLFPAAIVIQRETVRQVENQQFINNTRQLLDTFGFVLDERTQPLGAAPTVTDGWDIFDNIGATPASASTPFETDKVFPLRSPGGTLQPAWPVTGKDPFDTFATSPSNWGAITFDDRSYPAQMPTAERSLFWIPLIRDNNPLDDEYEWRCYFFLVRGQIETVYTRTADSANANDPIQYDNTTAPAEPAIPSIERIPVTPLPGATSPTGGNNDYFRFETASRNNPRIVRTGEKVLDELGTVYFVDRADNEGIEIRGTFSGNPEYLWVAAPHIDPADPARNTPSTFVDLFVLNMELSNNPVTNEDILRPSSIVSDENN